MTDLLLTYLALVTLGLTLFVYTMYFLAPRRRRKPRGPTCWCVAFGQTVTACNCVRFEDGDTMREVTAVAAAVQAGITYRQLDYWCRTGLIKASGRGGSGNQRRISTDEVTVLKTMARLVRSGVSPERAVVLARGNQQAIAELDQALNACRRMVVAGA